MTEPEPEEWSEPLAEPQSVRDAYDERLEQQGWKKPDEDGEQS